MSRLSNHRFVNGALSFAIGTRQRSLLVLALSASLVATLAGAFGTHSVPFGRRFVFWASLLLLNLGVWELLVRVLVPRGFGFGSILVLGCLVMLATIPFEIGVALRLLTDLEPGPLEGMIARTAGLTIISLLVLLTVKAWLRPPAGTEQPEPLRRYAGTTIQISEIAAIAAEDHYVRLHLVGGTSHLVLGALRDAIAQMEGVAGMQVHRSVWIADAHRGAARRLAGRWFITVGSDLKVPVSRSKVAEVRSMGWLAKV